MYASCPVYGCHMLWCGATGASPANAHGSIIKVFWNGTASVFKLWNRMQRNPVAQMSMVNISSATCAHQTSFQTKRRRSKKYMRTQVSVQCLFIISYVVKPARASGKKNEFQGSSGHATKGTAGLTVAMEHHKCSLIDINIADTGSLRSV